MVLFLNILSFVILSYALFELSAMFFHLPNTTMVRRINKVIIKEKSETDPITMQFEKWGNNLSKYIKLEELKRKDLVKKFSLLEIPKTPEQYIATAICMSGFFIVIGLLLAPLLKGKAILISLFIAIMFFRFEMKKIDDKILEKRKSIDYEMFPLASTIEQELKIDRDVIRIFSNYRKIAGDELKKELDITIADMRSGNIEKALLSFEKRNGSANLSEVIRGLLGVVNGDNNITYFQNLALKFQLLAMNLEKEKVKKLPAKMMIPISIIFLAIFVFIIYAFVTGMSSNMNGLM